MSRPATPNNLNGKCPAALLHDLRGAAAFLALDAMYLKPQAKMEVQYTLMSQNFYGDEATNMLSALKKMCNGNQAFANLFEFQPTLSGTDIVTKQHISGDGIMYLMNGQSINEEVLSCSAFTKEICQKVSERTLFDNASTVILANCKKVQLLVPKLMNKVIFLADDGTIESYRSGLNEKRFLDYINNGMYVLLKVTVPVATNDGEDDAGGKITDSEGEEARGG